MERASFKYSRAITDIEVILKEKGYELDKDIIPHLGMELLKAEQHGEKTEMLEGKLSSIIDILNYPLYPLTDKLSSSISDIAEAISESNHSPIQECPKCFAPISSKYDVCSKCGYTLRGSDSND
ncbi:hypothetical protein [Staphylococcus equorum]|uniref:hypothetical protein n=1 Tax=Staphylococcus equorum TaxID=246432 RepID=UPI003EB9BF2C